MIKAKLSFFWTSNSEGHASHGNKGTILILSSLNVLMSVISTKLYFTEISWVPQKLQTFKCTMLKTLNSDFLDWEDAIILFLMKGHFCKWKENCVSYFETEFFITMAAALNVYCLPEFLLLMTILKIFWKLYPFQCQIYVKYTASNRKQLGLDPSSDKSVFQFQEGLSKSVLALWWQINSIKF